MSFLLAALLCHLGAASVSPEEVTFGGEIVMTKGLDEMEEVVISPKPEVPELSIDFYFLVFSHFMPFLLNFRETQISTHL